MKAASVFGNLRLKFEPELEKEFLLQYYSDSITIVRLGIVLSIILYALFGILDEYMLPLTKATTWFIRFAVVIPLLILILAASFSPAFSKIYAPVVFCTTLILGYGIVFMIYFSRESEPGYSYYYSGLMLVIIWIGTFSQLRFAYASLSILTIMAGYLAVSIFEQKMITGSFANPKFPIFINNSFFFISSAIVGFFSAFSFEKARRNSFLQRKNIELEKRTSDKLLLNILPASVAEDLKITGKTLPREFDNVTVFFSDIIEFTKLSAKLEPGILIDTLNELFTAFDNIMEKYNCERIKTIGDAYMAVSGMPEEDPRHAENIARAAREIIDYCKRRNRSQAIKLHIRIGIHSGKVVGGVVGIKKYIYDVFGSTINIASRMETYSESMRINISETTYALLKTTFTCTKREAIPVKGVGKMHMYFLK